MQSQGFDNLSESLKVLHDFNWYVQPLIQPVHLRMVQNNLISISCIIL